MSSVRVALANLKFPATREESVAPAWRAIADAGREGADVVCFPECFVPGYRSVKRPLPAPDAAFLESAWDAIAVAAEKANVAGVLGTERVEKGKLFISALVVDRAGQRLGFQDKVQLDPTEEA